LSEKNLRSIRKYFLLTTCIYLGIFSQKVFSQSKKNNIYWEPFFKIDYQIWQNEQRESKDDGNYTYKFRGLYYGPRIGLKAIKSYNSYVIYGAEASYSYLFNTYSPDNGTTDEAKADDGFETDSTASQYQLGLFTGIQYKRFGLKFQYIPLSAIENEAKYSTFTSSETKNTYEGNGIGVAVSYIYKPKVNLYLEYQTFTLNSFSIDGASYELPTSTGNMTFKEFTTTKYSFGVSVIF